MDAIGLLDKRRHCALLAEDTRQRSVGNSAGDEGGQVLAGDLLEEEKKN